MSRHVWLAKRFKPQTIKIGLKAYQHALNHGASIKLACCFAGYVLERMRQSGPLDRYTIQFDGIGLTSHTVQDYWRAGKKSHYKYSKGKNAAGYARAGRLVLYQTMEPILASWSEGFCLLRAFRDEEDCVFALHDWMEDHGMREAALLRPDPSP